MNTSPITTLFLDIGGVLLTNGWDHKLRKQTAEHFQIDFEEMSSRHHITYDTYESGKSSWEDYLEKIIFYKPQDFDSNDVKRYVLEAARPLQNTIDLIRKLRSVYQLKIAVVSNEGRELAVDRIERFQLREFVDFFVVSAFVHLRKPDLDIYRLALDVAQVKPEQVAYIEDRDLLVEVASKLGIHGIHHREEANTREALAQLGLTL
ncbi:MAG: hydrolase [Verrucomicrobia bacterium]|nr:MAG: hydrolase [Verrucomicrobiota bacterium]